jgi:hypothetical protein
MPLNMPSRRYWWDTLDPREYGRVRAEMEHREFLRRQRERRDQGDQASAAGPESMSSAVYHVGAGQALPDLPADLAERN